MTGFWCQALMPRSGAARGTLSGRPPAHRLRRCEAGIYVDVDRTNGLFGVQAVSLHGATKPETIDPDANADCDLLGSGRFNKLFQIVGHIAVQAPIDSHLQPFELWIARHRGIERNPSIRRFSNEQMFWKITCNDGR